MHILEMMYKTSLRHVTHFGPQEWLVTLVFALGIGAFLLRGFGSRKNY